MIAIDSANLWYWIGFFAMLIGVGLVYWMGRNLKKSQRYHLNLALMVTCIATVSYFALASGYGFVNTGHATVFVSRYIDWVLVTPIILLSLLEIALPASANPQKSRERTGLISSIIFADVWMVSTSLIASLSSVAEVKRFWFSVSCLAFIVIIWLMYGEVRQKALLNGPAVYKSYSSLLKYISCVWIWYPIIWLVGTNGTNTISLHTQNILYTILDVLFQVVFWCYTISIITGLKTEESKDTTTIKLGDV